MNPIKHLEAGKKQRAHLRKLATPANHRFEGCYHGHADFFLVKAGSGVATLGLPDSPGVTASNVTDTLVASYNDLDSVKKLIDPFQNELAAVIVEPIAGNMGLVPPVDGFLNGLRELCNQCSALLVFDEVMTGFRVDLRGAQGLYDVKPDLTTLGKVIGGGLPIGAYGGRRDIMEMVAPVGPMYQAGTLSGNPLAMAAGLATLEFLMSNDRWDSLTQFGNELDNGIRQAAKDKGVKIVLNRVGTMSGMYFLEQSPKNWSEVRKSDQGQFSMYFHSMLNDGVFYAPSPFEAAFISTEHDRSTLELTVQAAEKAFNSLHGS